MLDAPFRVARLVQDLDQARRRYRVGWGFVLRRFFGTLRARGYNRRVAVSEGLLDPRISDDALGLVFTKGRFVRIQQGVNPAGMTALLKEKAIFYAYCSARALPVPEVYGQAGTLAGLAADGSPLAGRDDWSRFTKSLPEQFIVKPSSGAWGRGVRLFRREGAGFRDDAGEFWRPEELSGAITSDRRYAIFVIQERLYSHPQLARLSGTPNLQTVRIVSWMRESGEVVLPFAVLKVIAGSSLIDNYDHGRTGNLLAPVDVETGQLEGAVGLLEDGFTAGVHRVHPRTSIAFDGYQIPAWTEVCTMVRRAALLFGPLRTIGWDVAITPSAELLLEGNAYWDPFNYAAHSHRRSVIEPALVFLRELERASSQAHR